MSIDGTTARFGLSRRVLLGGGAVGLAARRFGAPAAAAEPAAAPAPPGAWRTWLLASGDELRPRDPGAATAAERDELLDFQARRSAATIATVSRWANSSAVVPWTDLLLDLIRLHKPSPARAGRALALFHTAVHDTVIAAHDARAAFPRPAPWRADGQIAPLGEIDQESSFPSEHAAIAAAAAVVLIELFPRESADELMALADEAATSRLWAGAAYRGDVVAGLAIGRAVGERAVARAGSDGAAAAWDGSGRPTGDGTWRPTPPAYVQRPLDPLAGSWRTWVIPRGDAYRPPAPPAYGSPAWRAELAAVQEAVARRTPEQAAAVLAWAGGPGSATPGGLWIEIARDLVVRDRLDTAHAARALALTSVAIADAFVCCWDAKYHYWTARPITADPTLDVLIATPPFPSYTSGHSTISAAASTVLGHLFPADEADLAARAIEAKNSRLWAGIHFPIDNDLGAVGGLLVGRLVVARALADGAE